MKSDQMTVREAVKLLSQFNKWRRSDRPVIMPNPTEVGIAIDVAIRELNKRLDADAKE